MHIRIDDSTLRHIVNEYRDMPGLCLTTRQAVRLWRLDPEHAAEVLDTLVDARLLARNPQGLYTSRIAEDQRRHVS